MKILLVFIYILFLPYHATSELITSEIGAKTDKCSSVAISEAPKTTTDVVRTVLYKGTLNERINIQLYFKEMERACGGHNYFLAMYSYDTQEKWILLEVMPNQQHKNFCMVEDNFSGVLFLEEDESSLNGNWISPDTKKQFKVFLEAESETLDKTVVEQLDEVLFDDLIYSKNDC
ncbi:hypothetical protein G5B37_02175 [Rasiella rasia]|uniref:Uncharacterized protein n=1 Tax=Rasiella rasia TaxID=2744027 RepID=A0A6G6GL41_9FLAO|nr:hypothetical protein [Rasiella rasia]QIE58411.1 hypothetical protein G5B37_02175 [Rasiella rasia]